MVIEGFLKQVAAATQEEINRARTALPLKTVRQEAEQRPVSASFLSAMAESSRHNPGIIAEIKRASPSKGDIRPDLDVKALVEAYTAGSARAVSVLTEPRYFKGSLEDLEIACNTTALPILRKDFILNEYQIFEAKRAGASAVLLITTLLSLDQQTDFTTLVRDLGMEPLVEIHSEREFEQAYKAGAKVVGINNRNLSTLKVNPFVAQRVAKIFPREILAVEASGISSRKDMEKGLEKNIFNFLVGESIVRAKDPKEFIRTLCHTPENDHGPG